MKFRYKNLVIAVAVVGVFFIKLYLGLHPSAAPGMVPGGAAPEPMAVAGSAVLTALLALALLEGLFRLWSSVGKK